MDAAEVPRTAFYQIMLQDKQSISFIGCLSLYGWMTVRLSILFVFAGDASLSGNALTACDLQIVPQKGNRLGNCTLAMNPEGVTEYSPGCNPGNISGII